MPEHVGTGGSGHYALFSLIQSPDRSGDFMRMPWLYRLTHPYYGEFLVLSPHPYR